MKLENLIVTQEDLRNRSQLPAMINFVTNGGIFDLNSISRDKLIKLTEFPDGQFYIHDGHHRCYAIWHGGRDYLFESEYVVENWTYEQYNRLHRPVWCTPFDPRTEVRLADFISLKDKINALSEEEALDFIQNNKHLYVKPRTLFKIGEVK